MDSLSDDSAPACSGKNAADSSAVISTVEKSAVRADSASRYSGTGSTAEATNETPGRRQRITELYNWTNEELFGEILERLAQNKYNEVHGLVIAARDKDIVDIYLDLFPAIIEKYDEDFIENGASDSILEDVLVLVKSYGATKEKLLVLLEYSDRVSSWKAFLMLAKFMEEIMPEMKDLNNHANYDIQKVYIPSWVERFGKSIVPNYDDERKNMNYYANLVTDYMDRYYRIPSEDAPTDVFSETVSVFLRIFMLSMSKDYYLLDELIYQVLPCMPVTSYNLKSFITELSKIYKLANRPMPQHTLLFVNSIKSHSNSFPEVHSPIYRLELAIPAMVHSLEISTSNMFNVGYVILLLRIYLLSIMNHSVSREQIAVFWDLFVNLLICCEEFTLCKLREICIETFETLLLIFEPVGQLLIIRRLFDMIRKKEIKRKNIHRMNCDDPKELGYEPQILAWLIDLYRSKLFKYEVFFRELGFIWADLVSIRYPRLSAGLQYYTAVFMLAQEQALRKVWPELMLTLYEQYILPMQLQLSDWTVLVETEQRGANEAALEVGANQLSGHMDHLQLQTDRQQDIQSLPLLQFQFSQTLHYVEAFLREAHML